MIATSVDADPGSRRDRSLKIDIVVHGRFHAFHLARALLARGHDVRLLTNYPAWAVRRFGVRAERVRSFTLHGIASRIHAQTAGRFGSSLGQPALHRAFGAWAARTVRRDADLVYAFSGVAEELLKAQRGASGPRIWVVRGSSHIRAQHALLSDEEARVGTLIDKPTAWTIDREEREYALAERIVTLSTFSHLTFLDRGLPADKVILLVSAVDTARFRPSDEVIEERIRRIERGEPLRVLTVGTFSFRKGAYDVVEVADALQGRMQFRFVGDVPAETEKLTALARRAIDMRPRVMEFDLVEHYKWADIFLFPTIEDGFPAVVAQAQAAGLAVITTPNGSGPDVVRESKTGWIVPIRSPNAIADRLIFCDTQRVELAKMTDATFASFKPRDWSAMATDLEVAFADCRTSAMNRGG
jgi:glycosyltransferase involved in cell wall biosynthesis